MKSIDRLIIMLIVFTFFANYSWAFDSAGKYEAIEHGTASSSLARVVFDVLIDDMRSGENLVKSLAVDIRFPLAPGEPARYIKFFVTPEEYEQIFESTSPIANISKQTSSTNNKVCIGSYTISATTEGKARIVKIAFEDPKEYSPPPEYGRGVLEITLENNAVKFMKYSREEGRLNFDDQIEKHNSERTAEKFTKVEPGVCVEYVGQYGKTKKRITKKENILKLLAAPSDSYEKLCQELVEAEGNSKK